ncbi:hypothetical protein SKAU_G00162950 [Synaphobranchus kaupii]|uniref:Proteasome activator Blm10 middle HEAT repeats region domain-containing protein n=1 Tax=Synaphobranchus kaupii TaxID=118154 RepID=A0A9Q1FIV8_SYNKA|nr:hypothetical protein SKAU_G00162950 [Synaphobranchus kaupii]
MLVPRYLTNTYDIGHMVVWVSSLLGGPSKQAQKQLTGLFNSISSFFHPSNHGRWLVTCLWLGQQNDAAVVVAVPTVHSIGGACVSLAPGPFAALIVPRLPASVVRRLHRERFRKPTWLTPVPESHKLTEQDITDFVESMKQPVLLAMFSKTGSLDAAQALQNLALMRPRARHPFSAGEDIPRHGDPDGAAPADCHSQLHDRRGAQPGVRGAPFPRGPHAHAAPSS